MKKNCKTCHHPKEVHTHEKGCLIPDCDIHDFIEDSNEIKVTKNENTQMIELAENEESSNSESLVGASLKGLPPIGNPAKPEKSKLKSWLKIPNALKFFKKKQVKPMSKLMVKPDETKIENNKSTEEEKEIEKIAQEFIRNKCFKCGKQTDEIDIESQMCSDCII